MAKTETESQTEKATKPMRSRAETERRLIDVALEQIRDKGVLAGLNLREVAEGAGVNRGNIYHYFGSRQELLRAAINRQFGAIVDSLSKGKVKTGFVARRLRSFRLNNSNDKNQMKDVKKFREEGEALHKAGKHQESVDTLAKAMKILKI